MDDPRASLRLDPKIGGSLLDNALAKRAGEGQTAQSYRQHVTDVYLAWCGVVEKHKPMLARAAVRNGITLDRLLQSSLLCVALHDIGKLADNFQQMMLAPDPRSYRAALQRNYRHEIAGLWFVEKAARALADKYGPVPGEGLLEVLAVAGHHKYLADNFLFAKERFEQALEWKPNAWTAVCNSYELARGMFGDQGWELPLQLKGVTPDKVKERLSSFPNNYPFACLLGVRDNLAKQNWDKLKQPLRELFVLLKGLLMTADWTASGAALDPRLLDATRSVVRVKQSAMMEYMKVKVEEDRRRRKELKPFMGFRPFQTACGQAPGNVLAIAPTGSGKTEAALLWALGQIERGQARKLLFLLPTMVTANSLYQRIDDFFRRHDHEVGLVHSTADLLRDENPGTAQDAEADRSDVRMRQLRATHLMLPVTVGTVDQLLATLFHAGRWALKSLAAADAAIVVDEVHAYDPHTTGLLVLLFKQFCQLGTRFMVMSATMPTDLQNTVLSALEPGATVATPNSIALIQDRELLEQARNTWEVCDQPLSEWLAENVNGRAVPSAAIRALLGQMNECGEWRRVLIVVNTVKRCQEVARLLQEFGPMCYHSKFIFRDRREKERHINHCQPRLVVATQVIEVSLDIDYDLLLTECAPVDALVQRAGRVNRTRRAIPGRIIVFPAEAGSEKVYSEPTGILDRSWTLCRENPGPLSETDLIELLTAAPPTHRFRAWRI